MVGLELTISGKTISISAEQGVASIIVTQTRNAAIDSIDLNVSGLNIANGSTSEMLDWYIIDSYLILYQTISGIADLHHLNTICLS